MKYTICSFDKNKNTELLQLEKNYLKRLKPHVSVELRELKAGTVNNKSIELLKEKQSQLLLEQAPKGAQLIVLDETGKLFTSKALSEYFDENLLIGTSSFCFCIGGPYGHSTELKQHAHTLFSLSPLTFTAEMTRFLLLEQLYRAISISKGLPYHKE